MWDDNKIKVIGELKLNVKIKMKKLIGVAEKKYIFLI